MRTNPRIKQTLSEIAKESVSLHNDPERQTKHIRRMVKMFDKHLSEEEKIFLVTYLMDMLHYRNLSIDPDNMLTISNIRIRTIFFVFICTVVLMIAAAALFKTNTSVMHLGNMFFKFLLMFSI